MGTYYSRCVLATQFSSLYSSASSRRSSNTNTPRYRNGSSAATWQRSSRPRMLARPAPSASCSSVIRPGRNRASDSTSAARLLMLISSTGWPGRNTASGLHRALPADRRGSQRRSRASVSAATAAPVRRTSAGGHGRWPRIHESPSAVRGGPPHKGCRSSRCREG